MGPWSSVLFLLPCVLFLPRQFATPVWDSNPADRHCRPLPVEGGVRGRFERAQQHTSLAASVHLLSDLRVGIAPSLFDRLNLSHTVRGD